MEQTKIGFIGTGVMGGGMAANLLKKGFPLAVFNRTKAKAQPLLAAGAQWMASVAALAAWADIVISIVSYPQDVETIYLGTDGILAHAKPGATVIDMTTSRPGLARKIYDAAKEKGIRALDAPVSGGDVGAKNGTLCIMVGGDESIFNAMRPVFEAMGSRIVLQGGAGAGQSCKMCNQIAIASNLTGVCEALAYAKAAGLSQQNVYDILTAGGANSWQLTAYAPRLFQGDFAPGFYVKHILKDIRIALEEAETMHLSLPALQLARRQFETLVARGLGDTGTQSLYALYDPEALPDGQK